MKISIRIILLLSLFIALFIDRSYSQKIDIYDVIKTSPYLSKSMASELSLFDTKDELIRHIDSLNTSQEKGVIEIRNSNSTRMALSYLGDIEDKSLFIFVYTALEPNVDSQIRVIDSNWNIFKKNLFRESITSESFLEDIKKGNTFSRLKQLLSPLYLEYKLIDNAKVLEVKAVVNTTIEDERDTELMKAIKSMPILKYKWDKKGYYK